MLHIQTQTVRTIIADSHNNIVMGQRGFESKSRKGYLDFFGGQKEEGETIRQAASRELREEAGLEINPELLVPHYVSIDHDGPREFMRHYFRLHVERLPLEKLSEHIGSVVLPAVLALDVLRFEPDQQALSRLVA